MKKLLAFNLAIVLCLSLCACGGPKQYTPAQVEEALSQCTGTLEMETSGDYVTSFTYVVEDVNAEDLLDREYAKEAITAVLAGDIGNITFGQVKVCTAIMPLMSLDVLFEGTSDAEFEEEAFVDKMLDIACDGKSMTSNGWTVTAEVDVENDTITIHAAS